jgi:hypothetical protein
VRRNSLPPSFERTGGLNPSEQAVLSGKNAWSNGKSELLVRVPAQLGVVAKRLPCRIFGLR